MSAHDHESRRKPRLVGRAVEVGIAERPFAQQALGINREPAARTD
jgi:hypothetical protein